VSKPFTTVLDEALEDLAEAYYPEHEYGTTWKESNAQLRTEAKQTILAAVEQLVTEARIEQSAATSDWIEKHIRMLHKDPSFKEVSSSVAFTYAEDQARQGRKRALLKGNKA
jgi:hypothetical protein